MGMNYFLFETIKCRECGHTSTKKLLIGKSSTNNHFLLARQDDEHIYGLLDWVRRMVRHGAEIRDETGEIVTLDRMLTAIASDSRHITNRLAYNLPAPQEVPNSSWIVMPVSDKQVNMDGW